MNREQFKFVGLTLSACGTLSLLLCISPTMVVYDGCPCGRERKWYEMPHSPWANKPLLRSVEKEGDTAHAHTYWDAQWGTYFVYPWQK